MRHTEIQENDKKFAETFSNFVNGKMYSADRTGQELANDHRYLIQQKFKVALAFMAKLADDYHHKRFDLRDEWACELSAKAIDHLIEEKLYYPPMEE